VFFDYDKSNLTSDDQDSIQKVVAWMQTYPDVTLTLEGHADERGTREYNLALGERRANAVRRYMEALGIDSARLSVISYGNQQPAMLGSNELAWAQNRRAVFVVN
jgi:peptidoglycan-associated lipoprotein